MIFGLAMGLWADIHWRYGKFICDYFFTTTGRK